MAASPDFCHFLGDDMQLVRFVPHEPQGTPYNPEGETVRVLVRSQWSGAAGDYPAALVEGGFEFAPADIPIIDAGGPYSLRFRSTEASLDLSFPNGRALLLWVEE